MYRQLRCWMSFFLLCCLVLWGEAVLAITTAPYYPLQTGNSWTYENNVSGTYTATILSSPVVVNSVTTYVLQDSDGLQSYLSNDQNGIRLHRQYDPAVWVEGVGYRSFDITYSPPMKFANAETYIGEILYSSGTAATTVSGLGTFNLTYEMTSTIDALEALTVPAGSYQAVKIIQSLHIYGNVSGTYQSDTLDSISWFTKDIGQVKYLEMSVAGDEEEVLTSTNVAPKVTPLAGPNGSIVPSAPQYVPVNLTTTFTVTPDPSYLIESVTGCGGTLTSNNYTTAPVTKDCAVLVTFAPEVTESDGDGDGVADSADNCPSIANPDQSDANNNDLGDACDNSDTDSDGLTDAEEYALGTDPSNPDTDADGVLDGNEVHCESNPLDPESKCNRGMPWLLLLLEDE